MKTIVLKIIAVFIFLILPLGVSFISADNLNDVTNPDNWYFQINPGALVDANLNSQWVFINGRLHAITLDKGQIIISTRNENLSWGEPQRLGVPDTHFTAYKVKDINNDNLPEIIAGTSEPGFIYIYRFNEGKWILNNSEKYVWASITNIAIGPFDDPHVTNVLVQNQRGLLYLLKITGNDHKLDLIWQSPSVWRVADSFWNLDFDQDGKEEIMASYKAGGIGILKADNKQIISVWDNYLWGKILAVTSGDWDDDGKPELFLSTSQKIIYILGFDGKSYQFEAQISKLSYTTEKLFFTKQGTKKLLLTTDTAGKLHFLEYNPKSQEWLEQFMCATGRVAQIIAPDLRDSEAVILLWGLNRRLLTVNAVKTKDFTLKYQSSEYSLQPPVWYQNNQIYLAPKALAGISDLGLRYSVEKTNYQIWRNQTKVVVTQKDNDNLIIQVNGVEKAGYEACLLINRELYFSLAGFAEIFGIRLSLDPAAKTIQWIEIPEATTDLDSAPAPTPTPGPTPTPVESVNNSGPGEPEITRDPLFLRDIMDGPDD